MSLLLHLGCGDVHLAGWVNIDADPGVNPDVVCDVRQLPYEDGAADAVLAMHLLEHFAHDEPVLAEWARVLRPGGRIVVSVPDLFAVYLVRNRPGFGWGPERANPIDVAYINAVAFGGRCLGPPWDRDGMEHRQIFIFDMLRERMAEFFPDAKEVPRIGELEAPLGDCMVVGTKPLP